MWPLCFWLPRHVRRRSAPAAALFAILTKVGVYAVLRLWLLFFGEAPALPPASGRRGWSSAGWLTLGSARSACFGAQELPRLAAFSLIVSSGTLLAAIGAGQAAVTGAALYYLVASTLGISAFFLLIELVERGRAPGADVLAVTPRRSAASRRKRTSRSAGPFRRPGPARPVVSRLRAAAGGAAAAARVRGEVCAAGRLAGVQPGAPTAWILLALLMLSGLATIVAASRTGVRIFWAADHPPARVRAVEMAPILLLLACGLALAVQAGPVMRYLDDAAHALHVPRAYIDAVLP